MTSAEIRERIHEVIFEADTKAGKIFDVSLLVIIVVDIITVMLESVPSIGIKYHDIFFNLGWIITGFFTVEYILRLYSVKKPIKYATSFYGIVDLMAVLPFYLSLFIAGTSTLVVIRGLRLLRVFRLFKMVKFLHSGKILLNAINASKPKIAVFLFFIMLMVTIFGSFMYLIEAGENSGFDSIPRGIYWAIVTLTTVGYGDIHPQSELGQFVAAIVMILGYAVIAVPTGIVSRELMIQTEEDEEISKFHHNTQACRTCGDDEHFDGAFYCKSCGDKLNEYTHEEGA